MGDKWSETPVVHPAEAGPAGTSHWARKRWTTIPRTEEFSLTLSLVTSGQMETTFKASKKNWSRREEVKVCGTCQATGDVWAEVKNRARCLSGDLSHQKSPAQTHGGNAILVVGYIGQQWES